MIVRVVKAAGIGKPASAEEAHAIHSADASVVNETSKPITETPPTKSFDALNMILTNDERDKMQHEIDAAPDYSATLFPGDQ
ncbi:MAG: hypothetical protein WCF90_03715 [Methanomicrobiales archaeon]